MASRTPADVPMVDTPAGPADNAAGLQQIKALLKAKDDTSRFVGLALLKSVLDAQAQLREDAALVSTLWESISPKFLARLLRAAKNDKITNEEAKNMVDIAVGVLHTFAVLLPEKVEVEEDKRFVERIGELVNCLVTSSAETTTLILQTLSTLVNSPAGATQLLELEDKSPLLEISPQQPLALSIICSTWTNAATNDSSQAAVRINIDSVVKSLVVLFKDTDAVTLLAFIAESFTKMPSSVIPTNPSWLNSLILLLKKLVTSRPTTAGRAAYIQSAAALLQAYPHKVPQLLFQSPPTKDEDVKPFNYLFMNLILIDIRSSYPTLLPNLNSASYPALSARLAAAFDVVSSFVGFLIRSLDDDGSHDDAGSAFFMPPDLLLKLRKDIAETMSLTIEYLRDRYDASVSGALGLHPEARAGTSATGGGTRLTITWESMKEDMSHDNLVLASIRTLAIWLREDENENLRGEAAGLTDLLTELYNATDLDFKFPILTALEATLTTPHGIDAFLAQDTWSVLAADLAGIVQAAVSSASPQEQAASRGIEIVRVLLAVVDDYAVTEPPLPWMEVVSAAAGLAPCNSASSMILELEIACVQLAMALLGRASPGLRRKYKDGMAALARLTNGLRGKCEQFGDGELRGALDDVVIELKNLR